MNVKSYRVRLSYCGNCSRKLHCGIVVDMPIEIIIIYIIFYNVILLSSVWACLIFTCYFLDWVSTPTSELVVWEGDTVRLDCSAYGAFANEPLEVTWTKTEAEGVSTNREDGATTVTAASTVKTTHIKSNTSTQQQLLNGGDTLGNIFPNGYELRNSVSSKL